MTTAQIEIPVHALELLARQQAIDEKLNSLHDIINSAERGAMGLTLDSAKTPEWKEAKRQYAIYFDAFRKVNQQLNKIRKAVGFENVNGKRVAVYIYK